MSGNDRLIRVAVDGPSGAGKSSVAKEVAKREGLLFVDTGAMYRAIGVKAMRLGIDMNDEAAMSELVASTRLELDAENVNAPVLLMDGETVGEAIRTSEASSAAAKVSQLACVRDKLVSVQRETARSSSVIMDGRDIGTVVMPDADIKFFLTASIEARAERRRAQLAEKGMTDRTAEEIKLDIARRDEQDESRALSPMIIGEDTLVVDSSDMTFAEVVNYICAKIDAIKRRDRA